jgi:hypothetical protein
LPVLAIAAPVRGEARYLMEWIAYHRALGVRLFLLADNGGPDHTSDLLQQLHARGVIFRFDWRDQQAFQMHFYQQAIAACRSVGIDGLFLIDLDEFLRPQTGGSVSDIAAGWLADPTIGAVALNWAIYGSGGRREPGEGLVIERFTSRAPQDHFGNHHSKAFVRVAMCDGVDNPHAVTLRTGRYADARGEDVAWDQSHGYPAGITRQVIWDNLRVDHFIIKSQVEFQAKRERGAFTPNRDWDRYFRINDRNEIEDPVPQDLVARTKADEAIIRTRDFSDPSSAAENPGQRIGDDLARILDGR